MKNNTFYSYSFGCRVNEAEKEEIDRKMSVNGFIFNKVSPDVFIVNTCSITKKAEREARQLIYQTKKNYPKAKIIITGCSATYWLKNNLYKKLPVEMIVDNINKEYLVDLIVKRFNLASIQPHRDSLFKANKFIRSGRAMIKIQDGCQRYCTFCIVPYLRGMPKSNKIADIVSKINDLSRELSLKEVILTAINTQAFGYDTKESFIKLLKKVLNNTDIPRVSLGSIHPWSLTDDFLTFYRSYQSKNRLVNFFHVPLQSGSNKILTLMKRGYQKAEMLLKLNELQKLNSSALLATDVIVGFLEETDADFNETYEFLKNSPINKFHVFRFSKRSKTQADYMAKRLSEPKDAEKLKRAQALIKLSREKYEKFLEKNVGRTSSVLFLEKTFEDYREGLLDNQLPILVPSRVTNVGDIKNIKVTEYKYSKLFGKII